MVLEGDSIDIEVLVEEHSLELTTEEFLLFSPENSQT
ncbi:hypothetical protein AVEN_8607-1, partial [Araneus ventricosus]